MSSIVPRSYLKKAAAKPTRPTRIADERIDKLLSERRFCYVIPESGYVKDRGYRVSIAIENESGHFPTGNIPEGGDIEPWYWGETFQEAQDTASRENRERLGLSALDAYKIVMSTMGARPIRRVKGSKRR